MTGEAAPQTDKGNEAPTPNRSRTPTPSIDTGQHLWLYYWYY